MNRRLVGVATLSVVCLLASCKQEEPLPPPRMPTIDLFTADRSEIAAGESATLSFSVGGADTLELFAEGGEPIAFDGGLSGGTAVVTPGETSIYVLRATGPGGRASAFVQIAVGEPLRSLILVAVPPEVDPGQPVDLIWSAQGAKAVELKDDSGAVIEVSGTSGAVHLNPTKSARYTLTASGADGVAQTAQTDVRVRPVLERLEVVPGLVNAGEAIEFSWTAHGADQVVISEKTFGELFRTTTAADASEGRASWTVPTELDGAPLLEGFRLEFTVTVSSASPDVTITRTVIRHLGQGPVIHAFTAPEFATPGSEISLSWTVSGVERLQIYANGLLVSEPRAADAAGLEKASVRLPAPKLTTNYRLVAHGFDGATASATRTVSVAAPPTILSFNLTTNINQVGDAATATWATADAAVVQLRIKNGPVVFSTADAAFVAQGLIPVHPGRTTVYVLDAINSAGDAVSAEAKVTVGTPADVTYSPSHPFPGENVTVSWNLPGGDVLEVIGVPTSTPERNVLSNAFVELAGGADVRQLEFADVDNDVAELPSAIAFRFPVLGSLRSRFFVSTNGFVAFEPVEALPVNEALPSQARIPALVAPLWDDLVLGSTGHVLYRVDGTTFPRRLIIQWSQVELKDKAGSKLDFQVQLFETSEVRFLYKQLDDGVGGPADATATIGVHVPGLLSAAHSTNGGGSVAVDDELIWFSSTDVAGSFTAKLYNSTRFSLFYRRMNGDLVNVSVPVAIWSKDLISIREAMPLPVAQVNGQWVELENTSKDEVSLAGTKLLIDTVGEVELPGHVVLDPGQKIVFGQSVDLNENGGVQVDEVLPGFSLASADGLQLQGGSVYVSRLAWTSATPGQSVELPQRVLNNAGTEKVCPRNATYGTDGAKGTPGATREACWNYRLEPIAFDAQDILAGGKVLFQYPFTGRDWTMVPLTQRAFPLFGAAYEEGLFSGNGFISFVNSPGTVSDYESFAVQKWPRFTIPNAAAVPFADAIEYDDRPESMMLLRRIEPGELGPGSVGHWVTQWYRGSGLTDKAVDVTFQAKLFDDGVIEYHYAQMLNGTDAKAFGEGEDASSWLENTGGTEALIINAYSRTPGIQSYSAFRYTPVVGQ